MSTVPVFAPDGSLGDIPYEHLHAAIAAGAKPGVTIKAPDGSIGVVPADHYQEAVKAGGQVVPFGQDTSTSMSGHPMMPKTQEGIETATKDISDRLSDRYAPAMQMALGMGVGTRPAEAAHQAEAPQPTQTAPSQFTPEQEALRAKWKARGGGVVDQPVARQDMQGGPQLGQRAQTPLAAEEPLQREVETPKPVFPETQLGPETPPAEVMRARGLGGYKAPENPAAALGKLKQPVNDIVDSAIPPDGPTRGTNLLTKARIDHHLAQGDVEGAQAVLDSVKKPVSGEVMGKSARELMQQAFDSIPEVGKQEPPLRPMQTIKDGNVYEYEGGHFKKNGEIQEDAEGIVEVTDALEPQKFIEGQARFREPQKALNAAPAPNVPRGTFPPEASKVVPSVQNIRETDAQVQAAEAQPRRYGSADAAEDRALGQEMNWNLERHGFQAESEARREFIARNSTGMTKGELNRQFDAAAGKPPAPEKPVKYTKTPGVKAVDTNDDLLEKLQQSLEDARAKRR